MRKKLLVTTSSVALLALLSGDANAQSSPGWSYGYQPTAAQWNQAFAGKQDYNGVTPLNTQGGVMLGPLVTAAATANAAGFNITPGVAPNAPNNGDMWTTAAGLFVQINGSTAQLSAGTAGAGSLLATNNSWTGTNTFNAPTIFNALITTGSALTVGGTATFQTFVYSNYNASNVAPTTGTGLALSNNFSGGNLESDIWNTGTGASVSFIFKQMIGAGTFKNLIDIGLGTGSSGGFLDFYGITSGKITLQTGSAAAGTWNWVWPTTVGAVGSILTSQGGTGAMTWSTAGAGTVTSAQTSGSAGVTASGTCTITTSGNCSIGIFAGPPQGRLTLISGQPVMTVAPGFNSGTAGAQTLYYAPYNGMTVPIWNGASLVSYQFTNGPSDVVGQSISLAGGTAWAAGSLYDTFDALNGTALTLCTGPAWSNATTRGTAGGIGLTRISGVLLNTGTMTCRSATGTTFTVNANRGTYLGTFAVDANAAGQITFTTGSGASGGSAAVLNLYNYGNRVVVVPSVIDNAGTYTYTSASIRAANNSVGNSVTFVTGVQEDGVVATYMQHSNLSPQGATFHLGIGLDSTSAFYGQFQYFSEGSATGGYNFTNTAGAFSGPLLGQHFWQALEQGDGTNANHFNTDSTNQLSVQLRM